MAPISTHRRRPTRRRLLALVGLAAALAVVVVAGCGGSTAVDADDPDGPSDPGATSEVRFEDLVGRTFRVETIREGGTDRPVVERTTIEIGFVRPAEVGPTVTAEAGCNHMGGPVAVTGGHLVVDSFGGTLMGCDPDRQAQDAWVAALLQADPAVELDGARLRLTTPDTTVELVER